MKNDAQKEIQAAAAAPVQNRKKRPQINVVAVILSVFIALSLWIYVLSVDSPTNEKTYSAVNIELVGVDTLSGTYGFSVLSGFDLTADVTLRGKRGELNRLSAEDITASVSLVDINAAGSYQKQVVVSLPAGMDLVLCSPGYITVDVDVEKTLTIPVLEPEEIYSLDEGVFLRRSYSQESIAVKGPQAVLDRIEGIRPIVELGELHENVTKTLPLRYVDANGNEIKNRYLVPAQNTISISYSLYKEKTVPLTLEIETQISGESVEQEVSPSKITVQGPPQQIDELTEIFAKTLSTVDMKSETNSYSGTVVLPDGFESATGTVNYTAQTTLRGVLSKNLSMSLSGDNVRITGENAAYQYAFSADSLNVVVRALQGKIDAVDASSVSAIINLSSFTAEGTYNVDVSFTVASDKQAICYVVSAGALEVTLRKA